MIRHLAESRLLQEEGRKNEPCAGERLTN